MSFTPDATVDWAFFGGSLNFTEAVTPSGVDELSLTAVDGHVLANPVDLYGQLADAALNFMDAHGAVVTDPSPPNDGSTGPGSGTSSGGV